MRYPIRNFKSAVLVRELRFPVARPVTQEIEKVPDTAVEIAGAEEIPGYAHD